MRRIVWVAVTILVMMGIMGFALHTMKRIDQTNKERRQREAGEAIASQIAVIPETTTIWDKLRATEAPTYAAAPVQPPEGLEEVPMPQEEQDPGENAVPAAPQEQDPNAVPAAPEQQDNGNNVYIIP